MYPYQNIGAADLPGEEWRVVVGFDYYEVSSRGRVRLVNRLVEDGMGRMLPKTGRVLRQKQLVRPNAATGVPNLSLQVCLYLEGKAHYMSVRRLVYLAFVDAQLAQELVVMNRDGDGYNNSVENLLPGTKREWARRVDARGRRTSALSYVDRSNWPKTSGGYQIQKAVGRYNQEGNLLGQYVSIVEAACQISSDVSCIKRVLYGRWKQHKGFVWRYID